MLDCRLYDNPRSRGLTRRKEKEDLFANMDKVWDLPLSNPQF